MADFDDAIDPELGAACNRLAAFCESLPAGVTIDDASGLAETDLVAILRRLHATRLLDVPEDAVPGPSAERHVRASVPLTRTRT